MRSKGSPSTASLSDADQKRLKELKSELDNILKEKYLEVHPEQRKNWYVALDAILRMASRPTMLLL